MNPGRLLAMLMSAPVAEQAQHHQEQVDEVEVERERAHHSLAATDGAVIVRAVHLLDPLRVPSGQSGEYDHADDRDREGQGRAGEEKVGAGRGGKGLTSEAMMMQRRPITRNEPKAERSRWVV